MKQPTQALPTCDLRTVAGRCMNATAVCEDQNCNVSWVICLTDQQIMSCYLMQGDL